MHKNHPTSRNLISQKFSPLTFLPGDSKDFLFCLTIGWQTLLIQCYPSFDLCGESAWYWCCCTDKYPLPGCLSPFPYMSHQVPFFICLHSVHQSFFSAPTRNSQDSLSSFMTSPFSPPLILLFLPFPHGPYEKIRGWRWREQTMLCYKAAFQLEKITTQS